MKQKSFLLFSTTVLMVLICACSDPVQPDWNTYLITRQQHRLSASQSELVFHAMPSGSETLDITAEQTSWQITDIPAWVTVSPTEGTSSASVQVTSLANYAEQPRKATLTLSSTEQEWPMSLTLSLTQEGCQFEVTTYSVNGCDLAVIPVKGGKFRMGSTSSDDESPVHEVEVSDFSLMQTEVTQGLWKAVTGSLHDAGASASLPVCHVSWDECQNFIVRLRLLTGMPFRLPTEAEWEFAARGGSESGDFTFSGSNNASEVAVSRNVSSALREVKTLHPNELGFYDMSGNAYEWCNDYYGPYDSTSQHNPQGPAEGAERVIRGGSFAHDEACARITHRAGRYPDTRSENIGFRLALAN